VWERNGSVTVIYYRRDDQSELNPGSGEADSRRAGRWRLLWRSWTKICRSGSGGVGRSHGGSVGIPFSARDVGGSGPSGSGIGRSVSTGRSPARGGP